MARYDLFSSSDGHFIDDPLYVVNVKPDFSDLGLQPDFLSNNSDFRCLWK